MRSGYWFSDEILKLNFYFHAFYSDSLVASLCLNQGQCIKLGTTYSCNCTADFTGHNCETDKRKCSSIPCLGNGACSEIMNGSDFQCNCTYPYIGRQCQETENLCANKTCSNQGWCFLWL